MSHAPRPASRRLLPAPPLLPALLLLVAVAGPPAAGAGTAFPKVTPGIPPDAAAEADPARWTVDDLVRAESARAWDVASDGSFAVWLRSTVEKVEGEEKRVENLWISRLDSVGGDRPEGEPGRPSRPLTRSRDSISSPALSPDDRLVAFLTDRDLPGGDDENGSNGAKPAETQLWVLPLEGGEAYPVTRFDRAPRGFGWIDGETLVVAAAESPSAVERRREEDDDTAVVVEGREENPPVRLFRVTLEGKSRRLTTHDDWIEALAVSPDGRRAVVTAQQSLSYEFDQRVPPETFLVDLETGERRRLELVEPAADGGTRELLPFDVRWELDGSGFYFADAYTTHPVYRNATVTRLHHYQLAGDGEGGGRHSRVDLAWERGLGGGYAPTRDGFVALLADGVRYRPARYVETEAEDGSPSWRRHELAGSHDSNIDRWEVSEDGVHLVYRHSTATTPPQWWAAELEGGEGEQGTHRLGGERKLTDLNPSFEDKPTGRAEVIRFEGARGDTVEALLHYPLGWREGERHPLILDIHGGPTGVDRDSWSQRWAHPGILWRQQGAFILQVNYHGSTGYGLEWAESIERRYYELEIPDLEAGVDHVLSLGLADPERLATSGWSNGGILSAELITRTGRYRAASVGAADVEWISDWANVDFGAAFDNYYFGGPPWENVETYVEKSPFFRLTEVTTPTIVYTGTEDRNVPPHQSWSLFRALQQIGEVPVRLVLFPGEPHGLRKVAHQRRKLQEDLAWFDRHLFGVEAAPGAARAIRDGSPLEALLARAGAERSGGSLGRMVDGTLVPETVPLPLLAQSSGTQSLEVGRFEVTRDQWRAFTGETGAEETADGDLPVTAVGFEGARRYVAWLSETTGEAWRLPTRAEAEKLAQAARGGGNTLEHWAGYRPNPEDRARLLQAVGAHGEGLLLRPVGSFPGFGEPAVFDLDGNAAEWAVEGEGERFTGVPVGPSADRTTDPRSTAEPGPAYTGLRVIREPR